MIKILNVICWSEEILEGLSSVPVNVHAYPLFKVADYFTGIANGKF